jgi:hypothetical protein
LAHGAAPLEVADEAVYELVALVAEGAPEAVSRPFLAADQRRHAMGSLGAQMLVAGLDELARDPLPAV